MPSIKRRGSDPVNDEPPVDQPAAEEPMVVDDDGEEEPVLTAAERGLTLDTWIDRPVEKTANSQQLKILSDEFKPLLEKLEFTLEQMQETAMSLAETGIEANESKTLFGEIDKHVQLLLDEIAIVRLRRTALQELQQALEAAGEMDDIQGRYRADCKRSEEEYAKKTARQRFSRNEAYIKFRAAVWESQYGNERAMPPVVDLLPRAEGEQTDDGDDDSDDEIQQGGAIQTFKDPITLMLLEDPQTSTACPHSYSRASIINYLEGTAKQCPVAGCDKFITEQTIRPDPGLARRIAADQRRKEREQAAHLADEDVEELDDD